MADRNLVVRLIGDPSSLLRSFTRTSTEARKFDAKISISARASANAQIAASAKKTARLREEIVAYNQIAAAAARGSQEQLAAAQLSGRAQRSLSRSLGVSARESAHLAHSSASVERGLGRATRGALAGSGVFRGLGRSIAFASGGFLAFASAGQFLRTSIDAAKEAAVTQKQLGAQFRASGQDLTVYQGAIDETANRLSLLAGFENDEIKAGFTTIFRASGNVSKSLRDVGLAADIARAKHIDLSKASTLVAKVEAGNIGILRRQGVALAKNATVEQALAIARRKFAGQAAAGTTAQERFGAVLHNTEEIIGTALLPTLNRYLEASAEWLTQMNESGELQRDVSRVTHEVARAFGEAARVAGAAASAFRGLNKITGGTTSSLELLAAAFVAVKVQARLAALGLIGSKIAGIGSAAAASEGQVSRLSVAVGLLGRNLITAGAALALFALSKTITTPQPVKVGASGSTGPLHQADIVQSGGQLFIQTPGGRLTRFTGGAVGGRGFTGGGSSAAEREAAPRRFAGLDAANAAFKRNTSLQGQFNLADLKLQQALLTKTTADDRVRLVIEAAITRQQLAQTKTLKDRTAKTQQLVGILSQIQGIDQANAEAAKAAAAAAKEAAKAARERVQQALQAREFKVLNLDPTGQAFTPGVKALRRELGNVGKLIKGTSLDTKKNEGLLGNVTKLLFGKDANRLTKDVRSTVKQMLDALNDELKNAGGPQTRFQKADLSKLTSGFGLSNADRKRLESRFSVVGAGGTVPRQTAMNGGFGGQTIVVHHQTKLDGKVLERSTTKHQQKRARRNPGQRRGPNAGI